MTNDDGSNAFTGSSGGDNSTDNTSVFKEGGGNTDVTAQNLIANDTNADKIWVISDLSRITSYNVCYTKLLRQLQNYY